MTSIAGTSSADTRIFNAGRQARQDAGDPVNPTGNTSRTGATDTRTEKSAQTSLSVGDRGPEVQQVQQALDDAGYSPGPIDGIFGLRTQDAARGFQQERIDSLQATLDNGPPPAARSVLTEQILNLQEEMEHGVVGEETEAQLANVERDAEVIAARPVELGVGDRGTNVLVAQQALADAGHPPGPIDGIFGEQTATATQSFQQERINSIQQTLDGGPPPAARGELQSRIDRLEDEMAQGVIGVETQAQIEQLDRDGTILGTKDIELGLGSRGADVVTLQENLVDAGFFPGAADGIFGSNTAAATNEFQQARIDSLEQSIANGPPPQARGVLSEQLSNLRDEQARGIAGEETQAQLSQQLSQSEEGEQSTTENESAPGSDNNQLPPNGGDTEAPDLDIPDSSSALDSALEGDYREALEKGLNSEGDSVTLNLGAGISVPIPNPLGLPLSKGIEGELEAKAELVDGAYELSISAEAAVTLGLEVKEDVLDGGVRATAGAEIVYKYDSVEDLQQGIDDLVAISGKTEQIQEAAGLAADAAGLANGVADRVTDYINGLGFPVGPIARRALGDIDNIVDDLIDTVPDRLGFEVGGRFIGLEIDGLKEDLQRANTARHDAEDSLRNLSEAQSDATERLNTAYDGFAVSGGVGTFANLGLPLPIDLKGLGASGGLAADATVTGRFDADGNITVETQLQSSANAEAGLGIGGSVNGDVGVTISQEFKQVDGGILGVNYEPSSDIEVEFSASGEALVTRGAGFTFDEGVAGEVKFKVSVNEVGDRLLNTTEEFLSGDFNEAFDELAELDGDLTLSGSNISGAGFGASGGIWGANLSVDGGIQFEDKGEIIVKNDVSIEDAFEFLNEQVSDANDESQAAPA